MAANKIGNGRHKLVFIDLVLLYSVGASSNVGANESVKMSFQASDKLVVSEKAMFDCTHSLLATPSALSSPSLHVTAFDFLASAPFYWSHSYSNLHALPSGTLLTLTLSLSKSISVCHCCLLCLALIRSRCITLSLRNS